MQLHPHFLLLPTETKVAGALPVPAKPKGCESSGGLPFGLENCICDGSLTGRPAGQEACINIKSRCGGPSPFSAGQDNLLESVQKICDAFAAQACFAEAQNAARADVECANLLAKGSSRSWNCDSATLKLEWQSLVAKTCDPICPNCPRP